jgi:hypothetical protein
MSRRRRSSDRALMPSVLAISSGAMRSSSMATIARSRSSSGDRVNLRVPPQQRPDAVAGRATILDEHEVETAWAVRVAVAADRWRGLVLSRGRRGQGCAGGHGGGSLSAGRRRPSTFASRRPPVDGVHPPYGSGCRLAVRARRRLGPDGWPVRWGHAPISAWGASCQAAITVNGAPAISPPIQTGSVVPSRSGLGCGRRQDRLADDYSHEYTSQHISAHGPRLGVTLDGADDDNDHYRDARACLP